MAMVFPSSPVVGQVFSSGGRSWVWNGATWDSPRTDNLQDIPSLVGGNTFEGEQTFTGTVSGITKSMVGLGNVDNTSDASKPVSTATQTALNLKANINDGYQYVNTIYYTSNGTFTKATYPWLRAILVKCQGGGGGSGGCAATAASTASASGGGGGGRYSESFITNISGLASSVTVTRGAGGSAGSAGENAGSTGGTSSFGALVTANGGGGGGSSAAGGGPIIPANGGNGGSAGTADFGVSGGAGESPWVINQTWHKGSQGGSAFLGHNQNSLSRAAGGSRAAAAGNLYGAGANGGSLASSQSAIAGAAGGAGIVIVELYA